MKHRVAICLSGLVGNSKGKSHDHEDDDSKVLELSIPHWNFFTSNYECDYFIHTWSGHLKQDIINGLKPVDIITQDQPSFDIPKYVPGSFERKHAHWCRWFSIKESVRLKQEHEEKNNIRYDSVIVSRFDLAWAKQIDFKYLDMNKMWLPRWFENGNLVDPINYKCKDYWFLSSSKNIDKFSSLYDSLNTYTKTGACRINTAMGVSSHYLAAYHIKNLGIEVGHVLEARDNFLNCDFPVIRFKYFSANI